MSLPQSLLICLLCLFLLGCQSLQSPVDSVSFAETEKRSGLLFKKGEEQPLTGVVIALYDDGQQKYQHRYLAGKRDGQQMEWWPNGAKKVSNNYVDGKDTGGMSWYDNGNPKHQYQMQGYKMIGLSVRWHPNGQKKEEVEYVNGKKEGRLLKWDSQGNLTQEKFYSKGKAQSQ